MKIVVVGGGAAGFFSALAAKEVNPSAEIIILERSSKLLNKVRISGGGRCNVTHACFDPYLLVQNYPRGKKELLGAFHRFQPRNTIEWFKNRGVILKKEKDNRMFPISNSSETVINCFLKEAKKLGVEIQVQTKLHSIQKVKHGFELKVDSNSIIFAHQVILASGSSPKGWEIAKSFGHTIQTPVPSLFTFNVPSFPLRDLSGVSIDCVRLKINDSRFKQQGPLLITHLGFSGPSVLKLSSFGARFLAENGYKFFLTIDWVPKLSVNYLQSHIQKMRIAHPAKQLENLAMFSLPKSLWKCLYKRFGLPEESSISSLSKSMISNFCETLKRDCYEVCGKMANKEEFVTCGGITLSEVQFKTMESKYCQGLFFCGEVVDIDGITGGFNFQNAWTTGWIAGRAAAEA